MAQTQMIQVSLTFYSPIVTAETLRYPVPPPLQQQPELHDPFRAILNATKTQEKWKTRQSTRTD
jgi:hypothetical protein